MAENSEPYLTAQVILPNDDVTELTVPKSCPMIDFLIQVTSKFNLRPADYIVEAFVATDIRDITYNTDIIPYQPNTQIGNISSKIFKIKSKKHPRHSHIVESSAISSQGVSNSDSFKSRVQSFNDLSRAGGPIYNKAPTMVRSRSNYITSTLPPQVHGAQDETLLGSYRLSIHLPYSQLRVMRVKPSQKISEVINIVCDESNLNYNKYKVATLENAELDCEKTFDYYNHIAHIQLLRKDHDIETQPAIANRMSMPPPVTSNGYAATGNGFISTGNGKKEKFGGLTKTFKSLLDLRSSDDKKRFTKKSSFHSTEPLPQLTPTAQITQVDTKMPVPPKRKAPAPKPPQNTPQHSGVSTLPASTRSSGVEDLKNKSPFTNKTISASTIDLSYDAEWRETRDSITKNLLRKQSSGELSTDSAGSQIPAPRRNRAPMKQKRAAPAPPPRASLEPAIIEKEESQICEVETDSIRPPLIQPENAYPYPHNMAKSDVEVDSSPKGIHPIEIEVEVVNPQIHTTHPTFNTIEIHGEKEPVNGPSQKYIQLEEAKLNIAIKPEPIYQEVKNEPVYQEIINAEPIYSEIRKIHPENDMIKISLPSPSIKNLFENKKSTDIKVHVFKQIEQTEIKSDCYLQRTAERNPGLCNSEIKQNNNMTNSEVKNESLMSTSVALPDIKSNGEKSSEREQFASQHDDDIHLSNLSGYVPKKQWSDSPISSIGSPVATSTMIQENSETKTVVEFNNNSEEVMQCEETKIEVSHTELNKNFNAVDELTKPPFETATLLSGCNSLKPVKSRDIKIKRQTSDPSSSTGLKFNADDLRKQKLLLTPVTADTKMQLFHFDFNDVHNAMLHSEKREVKTASERPTSDDLLVGMSKLKHVEVKVKNTLPHITLSDITANYNANRVVGNDAMQTNNVVKAEVVNEVFSKQAEMVNEVIRKPMETVSEATRKPAETFNKVITKPAETFSKPLFTMNCLKDKDPKDDFIKSVEQYSSNNEIIQSRSKRSDSITKRYLESVSKIKKPELFVRKLLPKQNWHSLNIEKTEPSNVVSVSITKSFSVDSAEYPEPKQVEHNRRNSDIVKKPPAVAAKPFTPNFTFTTWNDEKSHKVVTKIADDSTHGSTVTDPQLLTQEREESISNVSLQSFEDTLRPVIRTTMNQPIQNGANSITDHKPSIVDVIEKPKPLNQSNAVVKSLLDDKFQNGTGSKPSWELVKDLESKLEEKRKHMTDVEQLSNDEGYEDKSPEESESESGSNSLLPIKVNVNSPLIISVFPYVKGGDDIVAGKNPSIVEVETDDPPLIEADVTLK